MQTNGLHAVNGMDPHSTDLHSAVSRLSAVGSNVNGLNLLPSPSDTIPPSLCHLQSSSGSGAGSGLQRLNGLNAMTPITGINGMNGIDGIVQNQSALPSTTRPLDNGLTVNAMNGMNGINSLHSHGLNVHVPALPNLSLSTRSTLNGHNGTVGGSSRSVQSAAHCRFGSGGGSQRTAAVVVTAPPLPAAALPDALKRSPSPHDGGLKNGLRSKSSLSGKSKKSGGGMLQKFECVDCGKRYKHLSNLRAHAKVHTAEAKVCPFCKKRFGRKANYEEHLRVHTGETPYECKYCQRKFKHRHSWKDHLRIHTGEKPYQCEICNRTFNVRHNLTVHYRYCTHTLSVSTLYHHILWVRCRTTLCEYTL